MEEHKLKRPGEVACETGAAGKHPETALGISSTGGLC